MELLIILLTSTILYIGVLAFKTKMMFFSSNMGMSYFTGLKITIYILIVHLKIAFTSQKSLRFSIFVLKQYFIRYDVPLVIFIEVFKANSTIVEKQPQKSNSIIDNFFKSKNSKDEFKDLVSSYCTA
ncbi:TPA: hypothetical protein QFC69_001806 [Enterococcus faecium]|uniref:hypothetical protein n=1 Tax=Enterococcus TaxID=1350 RepID=UPI0002A36DFA|nr:MULTISPECIES: hypothetical protein [Enterococcus]EJC3726508.1 hypothetical protein [Enterococcus faecium]EKK0903118.1 hypothetical protein [Enterococcus faecium]ELA88822.1 hypothetical protein OI5_04960 [Enterococcus faecium EnGen0009]MDB7388834.1 hypothetical protein [Enterococcus faecium]MDB7391251.1 hypothetical protein [Enterococcus faecium]